MVQIGKEQPRTIWKIYGASNNGIYGENNGYYSGLEAFIEDDTNKAYGIVNSLQGNIAIAIDDNKQVYWQKDVPLAYGPIEIPIAAKMDKIDAGDLLKELIESSVWQSRRIDPPGFVNFGARYYDPLTKRFLSCDPLGHSATPDLYSYADGDPVNRIDPDGRFTSKAYEATGQTIGDIKDYYSHMDYSWKSIKGELEKASYGLGPEIGTGVRAADEVLKVLMTFGRAVNLADRVAAESSQKGVIYKRTNHETGEEYIGKTIRDEARFKEHDRNLGVEHRYQYLDKNVPKDRLSYMEQRRINEAGGIKNLANKRNAMSEARYKEAEAKFNK